LTTSFCKRNIAREHLAKGVWLWRVHYGARDYVGRRGGDLMIDIDPANADIKQILRGQ